MFRRKFLLVFILFLGLFFVSGSAITKAETTQDAKIQRAYKLLNLAISNHTVIDYYRALPWNYTLIDVIPAIASVNSQTGLKLFNNFDKKDDKSLELSYSTAINLVRILKGDDREKIIDSCLNANDDYKTAIASSILINDDNDLKDVLKLIDSSTPKGCLILLSNACRLKSEGKAYDWITNKIKYKSEKPITLNSWENAFGIVNAYLNGGPKAINSIISEINKDPKSKEISFYYLLEGVKLPLALMFLQGSNVEAVKFTDALCEASKTLNDRDAFMFLGVISRFFSKDTPLSLCTELKARWKKENFDKNALDVYESAYYSVRALIEKDPVISKEIAEKLVDSILEGKDPESHYHMVGTILGVLAKKFPKESLEIAKKINSLEWYVNALRCIYRGWAMSDPKSAIKDAKIKFPTDERDTNNMGKKINNDILLEAIVGASYNNPALACDEFGNLPDEPARYCEGYCLIAPNLAMVDFERSIKLLVPDETKPITSDAALALSRILFNLTNTYLGPLQPEFYPEHINPTENWPGPFMSAPLRF